MDKEIVDVNFENWLRLLDSETDCFIPEECIPYLKMAYEAGKGCKTKKRKKDEKSDNSLFSELNFDINDLYTGMPEYQNQKEEEPLITALFKFSKVEDYEDFKNKVSKSLFDGEKVFDGMQKLTEKQSWYPHKQKASNFIYIDGDEE